MSTSLLTLDPTVATAAAGFFILLAAGLLWLQRSALRRRSRSTETKGRNMGKKLPAQDQYQRRIVTRGQSEARRGFELLEGCLQSSKHGLDQAIQLRRAGREQEATRELLLERHRYARRAAKLASMVGIDGSASIALFNTRRIQEWLRRAIALTGPVPDITNDQPLPLGKVILYRLTGGPRSGACYDLYLFQKANVEHYTKLVEEARNYQQHARESEARELLCKERDRCVMMSFLPGQQVVPM